ncbi:DNA mismatch endonuclease Vsr [Bradyrhizobium sp. 33ap4]|uniref:very short patch repair endonuclease n=1 Tax=Bradyrhizobium sp. 33ap4 TaxID=3061630 RepID=UPI00292D52A8|nr:DNA mismatch endonuclease Vsr [Bradyrhizobium sp. 33ap4]
MIDILSKAERSALMGRIRGADTTPERIVRRFLHRSGFRYRLHPRDLPGRPDIVLPKLRTVIFVHGCFWHRHRGCRKATTPSTRRAFWQAKFKTNVERDLRKANELEAQGWRTITVWECEVTDANLARLVAKLRKRAKMNAKSSSRRQSGARDLASPNIGRGPSGKPARRTTGS